MNINDIPSKMLDAIRLRFEAMPEVLRLRAQEQLAKRDFNFGLALETAKQIDLLFAATVEDYMSEAEKEVKAIDTDLDAFPEKERDEMMVKALIIFMACDIIDTAVIELNDIFHRSVPSYDISAFSDIQQLGQLAKQKLQYLQETSDYMRDLVWAEKSDNMYEMMQSKARSIMLKRKSSKEWGKTMRERENT